MLTFAAKYSGNIHSQNGEDGIIEECLKRLKLIHGTCCEFGGHDGYFCSNTRALIKKGWNGFMFDINPQGLDVMKAEITPENVNAYVPKCNVLSIDCDGPDYGIWKAYKGTPDIVVIEINSSMPPDVIFPINDQYKGTAYKPMVQLGIEKGYFLLCHTGNLILLRNDHRHLFPEVGGDGLSNHELYFNKSFLP